MTFKHVFGRDLNVGDRIAVWWQPAPAKIIGFELLDGERLARFEDGMHSTIIMAGHCYRVADEESERATPDRSRSGGVRLRLVWPPS